MKTAIETEVAGETVPPQSLRKLVTALYALAIGVAAVVTALAAGSSDILAKVYASLEPGLAPIAALPWVMAVATRGEAFPLAEAQAVLTLACFLFVFGTAWLGSLAMLRTRVPVAGTDLGSLADAIRTRFPLSVLVPPASWPNLMRPNPMTGPVRPPISPGDEMYARARPAGIDELLTRYYLHRLRFPFLAFEAALLAAFFLYPVALAGFTGTSTVVFFFGRFAVCLLACAGIFDLLLLLAAGLSRAFAGNRSLPRT